MIPFAEVLAALRAERDTLTARVADLDAAIAVIAHLDGEAAAPRETPSLAKPRKASTSTAVATTDDQSARILEALRAKSPQTPAELAKALKIRRPQLTRQLKPLLASGGAVATGTTRNRQFSLPPRSRAAKEVP